jgi:formylmethanofuran dehydrogenase subunit E
MEKWEECVKFHGHACPGLALGFKAAEIAMDVLKMKKSEDEELACVSENDACGVDAVQCVTGCTAGKGNLVFRKSGKMAFSFFSRDSGKSVRIVAKDLDHSLGKNELIEKILNSETAEFFEIKVPNYGMPEKARSFRSVKCENCGESCREDKIRLCDGKFHCVDCYVEYDRG